MGSRSSIERRASWVGPGFSIGQRRGYVDQNEPDKFRETDVLATLAGDSDGVAGLIVECKRTTKPWVVLVSDQPLSAVDTMRYAVASGGAYDRLQAVAISYGPFRVPDFVRDVQPGLSTVVGMLDQGAKDAAREAMAQAISGAWGFVADRPDIMRIGWPVVVIDGPLVTARFAENEDIIDEVDEARIFWRSAPFPRPAVVDVVRVSALPDYANRARMGLQAMRSVVKKPPPWLDDVLTT